MGGPVCPDFTNILTHEREKPLRCNFFNAGHASKGVGGHPLDVKEGCETCEVKPSRELGKFVSPLTTRVVFVHSLCSAGIFVLFHCSTINLSQH